MFAGMNECLEENEANQPSENIQRWKHGSRTEDSKHRLSLDSIGFSELPSESEPDSGEDSGTDVVTSNRVSVHSFDSGISLGSQSSCASSEVSIKSDESKQLIIYFEEKLHTPKKTDGETSVDEGTVHSQSESESGALTHPEEAGRKSVNRVFRALRAVVSMTSRCRNKFE